MDQSLNASGSMQDNPRNPRKGLGYPVNAPEWWPKPRLIERPSLAERIEAGGFGQRYLEYLESRAASGVVELPVEEYTPGQLVIMQDTTRMLNMNIHAPSAEAFHEMNPKQQKDCIEEFIGVRAASFFGSRMHRAGQVPVAADGEQQKRYSGRVYSTPEPGKITTVTEEVAALTLDTPKAPDAAHDSYKLFKYDGAIGYAQKKAEIKLQQEAERRLLGNDDDEFPTAEEETPPPHVPLSINLVFQGIMNRCAGTPLMDDALDKAFMEFIVAHNDPAWRETPHKKRLMMIQGIIDQARALKRKNRELGKKHGRDTITRKCAVALDIQLGKLVEEMVRQRKMNRIWPSPMVAAVTKAPEKGKEVAEDGELKKAKKKQETSGGDGKEPEKQESSGENKGKGIKKGLKKGLKGKKLVKDEGLVEGEAEDLGKETEEHLGEELEILRKAPGGKHEEVSESIKWLHEG